MTTPFHRLLASSIPLFASSIPLLAGPAAAATYTTVQEGVYWCSTPANCAWGGAGHPGAGDTGVIAHPTTLWGQGANPPAPLVVPLARLDLVQGGLLAVYEGRRLEFGGGLWSGGALDSCCNGGGTLANRAHLDITAASLPAFRNLIENNATLRVAPGAFLTWNQGNGNGLLANLTATGSPAVLHLDGTGRIGGVVTLVNEGIVRKTGAGTSVFNGKLRNLGQSLLYPGEIEVLGGTLAFADEGGFEGTFVSEGAEIGVGLGAILAIRDGGVMLLTPEGGAAQVYLTRGHGEGRVRLESGGSMVGNLRLPDQGAPAVIDFAPGLFEFAGGALGGFGVIRNAGEITIVGSAPKFITQELENAGTIGLPDASVTLEGVLRLLPGSLLEASGSSTINGAGNSRLLLDGLLRKASGAGTLALSNLFVFEGSGRLEVSGGQLLVDNYSQFRGTLHLDQATLGSPNPTIYLREEATLSGVGTVATSQLEHRGLLEPGAPYGALALSGTLLQNGFNPPLPTTRIAIGGPAAMAQHAQIQVGGDLRPFGILRVDFRDGYAPAAGTPFDLITIGGALTDSLARYQVVIEGLAPGFQYSLSLSPQNTVRLTALNQGLSLADLILRDGFED